MPPSAIDQQPSDMIRSGEITPARVTAMVDELFSKMLGMSVDRTTLPISRTEAAQLMAAIRISGNWNATLQIYAPMKLARKIACAMFAQDASTLGIDDVLDAFGEIVNVIGGNVKGLVDRGCSLSLPCVGMADGDFQSGGLEIEYEVRGMPLQLVLVEDEYSPAKDSSNSGEPS